jgi:hypothetical protein
MFRKIVRLACSFPLILLFASSTVFSQTGSDETATIPGWRYEFQRKYELFRDHGYDWRLGALFELTSEDGVLLAAGPILYHFAFRTFPYVYRMELIGGISIPTARYKVLYNSVWPALSERLSLELRAQASQLEVRNFYGYGNENPRNEVLEDEHFYRIFSREFVLRPVLRYSMGTGLSAGLGLNVNNFKAREEEDRFLNRSTLPQYGDDRTIGSIGLLIEVDTRDHLLAPRRGVLFGVQAWNYAEVFDNRSSFQKYMGDFRMYVGGSLVTDIMFAVRVHGEVLDGSFPFYEAAFMGGVHSLRGYPAQRFAGDASAFASADLRFSIGRWKLIVPTEVGLLVLGDAGRVWVDGDSPGPIHTDLGGGIWFAPLSRDGLFSLSLASSVEGLFIGGGVGFAF